MGMGRHIDVVVMRGGTSRGVFVTKEDFLKHQDHENFVQRILGSPHPAQINGLGGAQAVSSKFVWVGPAERNDADVSYQVAQVGVNDTTVDWSGTCGNLTAAVGPFAIEAGVVRPTVADGRMSLKLHNVSTGNIIQTTFQVSSGRFDPSGDTRIDGVNGTGSEILTEYLAPVGGTLGRLFPLHSPNSVMQCGPLSIPSTLVDITHPYLFVDGTCFDVDPSQQYDELVQNTRLQHQLEALRQTAADLVDDTKSKSISVPRIIACFPDKLNDIRTLSLSGGRFIPSIPVSGALALAGALRLPDTVPASLSQKRNASVARIAHPSGSVEVAVDMDELGNIDSVGLIRTARIILTGKALLD